MTVFAMMAGFNVMESGSAERKLTSFYSFLLKYLPEKKSIFDLKIAFIKKEKKTPSIFKKNLLGSMSCR